MTENGRDQHQVSALEARKTVYLFLKNAVLGLRFKVRVRVRIRLGLFRVRVRASVSPDPNPNPKTALQ